MPQHQLFDYLKESSRINLIVGLVITIAGVLVREFISSARSRKVKAEHEQIDAVRTQLLADGRNSRATAAAEIVISTATGQAPHASSGADDLKEQIKSIRYELDLRKVADAKDDAILEATLKASISNLDRRIEALEKDQLTKWDVATTVLTLIGGMATIIGVVFGILKYLHP